MTVQEVKIGFLWIKVAGWLIVALLSVIAWVTMQVYSNNTDEHRAIMKTLERDESDRMEIKKAILEKHPELLRMLFPTSTRSVITK